MRGHDVDVRLCAFAVALFVALSAPTWAQEPGAPPECRLGDPDCLSMGKRLARFMPSQRYESITLYDEATANRARAPLPPLALPAAVGALVYAPSLEAAGVLLVELAPGATSRDLEDVVGELLPPGVVGVVGAAERGSPVYSAGSVDHVLINQLIVKFRTRTPIAAIEDALAGGTILKKPTRPDYLRYVVEYPELPAREVAALSSRLDQREDVDYAQPNFIAIGEDIGAGRARLQNACPLQCAYPSASAPGADPLLAEQWYLDNPGTDVDIDAKEAWQVTPGDPEIVIAILDDAVETAHEDLAAKIHSTWNAAYGDTDLRLQDYDRHGTAVAGLAAAATGNGVGIAGIGANISLMPVRVWDKDQWGRMTAPHERVTEAILVAAETAHVLNGSFTLGSTRFPDVEQAIDTVMAPPLERVVVFATGNEGNSALSFPASLAGTIKDGQPRPLIAVGATDSSDTIKTKNPLDPSACNWGSNGGAGLSVVAPGVATVTTDRTDAKGWCTGNYAFIDGTSAAAPLVAGTAALLLSKEPGLSPAQVKQRLQATAIDLGAPGDDPVYGSGRIDACRALQNGTCAPHTGPTFTIPNPPTGLRILLEIAAAFVILALIQRFLRARGPSPPPRQ